MSIAAILDLAQQASAALAHPDRRYPLYVGLSRDALIEAARQLEEREVRVLEVYQAIDSLGLGIPRAPIGAMTRAAAEKISRERECAAAEIARLKAEVAQLRARDDGRIVKKVEQLAAEIARLKREVGLDAKDG